MIIFQAKVNKLGDLDLDLVILDCATPGSTERVAQTLEDLAGLIDHVGVENLCQQLGLGSDDCTL